MKTQVGGLEGLWNPYGILGGATRASLEESLKLGFDSK